ncbi:spore cortex biosynthesis protein YabQ [Clostridium sp. BJN0001]|uniref:spore cortex biosynthesis protein YabQ n=1 Tax=Clostridium sp. BJN0001 TaxID=2930219 RepID=UPI001FD033DF|nr:spore cortex biosynthesis protein YabQ [Clostridium sp. BJN0001]
MPLRLIIQFNIIFFSIAAGFIAGLLFDLYRIIRGCCKFKAIIIIEDILFFILLSLILFTFLLYMDGVVLNIYVYLSIIISALFYLKFISKYVFKFYKLILSIILKIIRIVIKNIIYIIKTVFYRIMDKNN